MSQWSGNFSERFPGDGEGVEEFFVEGVEVEGFKVAGLVAEVGAGEVGGEIGAEEGEDAGEEGGAGAVHAEDEESGALRGGGHGVGLRLHGA